jgi:hypothetical protein
MADEIAHGSALGSYEPPVADLIREVLGDTGELVRIEVALARDEVRREVAAARTGAIALAAAAAASVAALTMFIVAIVLGLQLGWVGALVAGAILLGAALLLGLLGWKAMPTSPMGETKGRLQQNVERLKEGIA